VWNLREKGEVVVPIDLGIAAVSIKYPKTLEIKYTFNKDTLTITFDKDYAARFFEITVNKNGNYFYIFKIILPYKI